MLIQWIVFIGSLASMGWLQMTDATVSNWLFLAPAVSFTCFYLIIHKGLILSWILMGSSLSMILYSAWSTHQILYLLLGFVMVLLFLSFISYRWALNLRIQEVAEKKKSMDQEAALLKERYGVRAESLHHLEQQVSSLVKLFEIARDLNECLSFSSLLSTI